MNLAQAIHERWAAAAELDALLPASRVYTGMAADNARPYAALSLETGKPASRHHDGSAIETVGVKIRVFPQGYDAGAAVAHQVKTAFDWADFALSNNDRVIDVRRCGESQSQDDDGLWQFAIEFECIIYLASGV